jgi:hypothetical protein
MMAARLALAQEVRAWAPHPAPAQAVARAVLQALPVPRVRVVRRALRAQAAAVAAPWAQAARALPTQPALAQLPVNALKKASTTGCAALRSLLQRLPVFELLGSQGGGGLGDPLSIKS